MDFIGLGQVGRCWGLPWGRRNVELQGAYAAGTGLGEVDLLVGVEVLEPGGLGRSGCSGGGLGGGPGELAGFEGGGFAAGGVAVEEAAHLNEVVVLDCWGVADLAGDFAEGGAALFELGGGLVVAGDDFWGEVLGLEGGGGGGKLGAHTGGALVYGAEVGFELGELVIALGVRQGCAAHGAVATGGAQALDDFVGLFEVVADLVGRAGLVFGGLGLCLLHPLAPLAQVLELLLGLRVKGGNAFVLRQHAQGLQHQRQLRGNDSRGDWALERVPGNQGVDGGSDGGGRYYAFNSCLRTLHEGYGLV